MSLSAEQLEFRRGHIGGSEIASILGLNPFASAIDVWLSKVEGYQQPVNSAMERGTFLEDGVARWYAARTGASIYPAETVRHPKFPHVGCTPDRFWATPETVRRLLSIKVPGNWLSEEWGEPHAWQVPTYAYVQLQYEMAVCRELGLCETDFAHLAAPLNGELEVLTVEGDATVQARLLQEAETWWARHFETKSPPPLDGSESAKQWLRRRFPRSEKPIRKATPQEDLLCLGLQEAERAWEVADKAYERARQPVEEAIGDAEGVEGPFGRITFRTNARGVRSLKPTWTTKGGTP